MAAKADSRPASFFKFWFPVFVWMALIFAASSIEGEDISQYFSYQDVAFHLFVYFILAFLFSRAVKNSNKTLSPKRVIIISFLFALLYGISDEFHQLFIPGRDYSFWDILSDSIGGFIGSMALRWQR